MANFPVSFFFIYYKFYFLENNIAQNYFYDAERNLVKCLAAFTDPLIFDVLSQKCQNYFFLVF